MSAPLFEVYILISADAKPQWSVVSDGAAAASGESDSYVDAAEAARRWIVDDISARKEQAV